MKIQIGNININNHVDLKATASVAGYAASLETVNETTVIINLGDEAQQNAAGVTILEIQAMITLFIFHGFSVQRI